MSWVTADVPSRWGKSTPILQEDQRYPRCNIKAFDGGAKCRFLVTSSLWLLQASDDRIRDGAGRDDRFLRPIGLTLTQPWCVDLAVSKSGDRAQRFSNLRYRRQHTWRLVTSVGTASAWPPLKAISLANGLLDSARRESRPIA